MYCKPLINTRIIAPQTKLTRKLANGNLCKILARDCISCGWGRTMKIFDKFSVSAATLRLNDEVLYAIVSEEIEKGIKRDGLWIKALADAKGNETLAKAGYVKLRVQSLKDEARLEQSIIDPKENEELENKARQARSRKAELEKERRDKDYYEKYVVTSAKEPNTSLFLQSCRGVPLPSLVFLYF